MTALADCKLGETKESIACTTRAENTEALSILASQARKMVVIYSRLLPPELYGSAKFTESIKQTILGNHFASIRIIVVEPEQIMSKSHRLIDLALRMNSFMHLRRGPDRCRFIDEEYVVLDEAAWYYRESDSRFESTLNFNDRLRCRDLLERFEATWRESLHNRNLRNLNL